MRRGAATVLLLLLTGCGTANNDSPKAAPSDQRLAELQTSMTELLERLDVINDRISRLEQELGERTSRPQSSGVAPVDDSGRARRPPAAGGTPALRSATIADAYRQAIVLFTGKRYADARTAFQRVFDSDPSSDLADNSLFWIGETYFAAGDYGNASRFYRRVADDYSDQNKAPDALYKLALTQEKTGDLAQARTTLQEVIRRYPYSSPAAAAKGDLQRIKY